MATLTNPITPQNIVDRYADFVTIVANQNIIWGTNALPFSDMPSSNFGGTTTTGKSITILGAFIVGTNSEISAAKIYDTLLAETRTYTRIRNLRAILFVTGTGGNIGSRPTPGTIFDQTQKSNLNTTYLQSLGTVSNSGVSSGQNVSVSNLERLFTGMGTAYNTAATTTATIQINVCHASCHSSCHGSRSRR
jgi:hypothetical protein